MAVTGYRRNRTTARGCGGTDSQLSLSVVESQSSVRYRPTTDRDHVHGSTTASSDQRWDAIVRRLLEAARSLESMFLGDRLVQFDPETGRFRHLDVAVFDEWVVADE